MTKRPGVGILACAILMTSAASGQVPASKAAFEAAAIRAASFPTPQTFQNGQFRTGSTIKGTSLDFEFVTLADLVTYAYRVKSFQLAGPDWMNQSRWNIVARLPEGSSDQAPEMMQQLLADRFKLAIHRDKRQQPVYELIAAKGGTKLEPAAAAEDAPADDSGAVAVGFGPGGLFPPGPPPGGGPPPDGARGGRGGVLNLGGTRISQGANCTISIEFDRLTMQNFADTLTPFLDKPVVNSTQLQGAYKIAMELPMEAMFAMMQNTIRNAGLPFPGQGGGPGFPGGPGGGPGGQRGGPLAGCFDPASLGTAGSSTSNTAIFQAVQKMGLRLQPVKAPFETIVVDRLEKTPTEN